MPPRVLLAMLALLLASAPNTAANNPTDRPSSSETLAGRTGIVHADGRVFRDDEGPFLALGTTLFWGLWGYEHDRDRLARNLAAIAYAGFDYVRVLAVVGPEGWRDRTVDPRDERWADRVTAFTDWVYDRYGLRVQWTVFGGVESTPTPDSRAEALDRLMSAVRGREQKIFALEIANEGWQNGFPGAEGQRELKRLTARARKTYKGLIATTAPRSIDCDAQRAWYADAPASFVTLHFPRDERQWAVIDEAWRDGHLSCDNVPAAYSNNEPIGPYSSVREDSDPIRLAMSAAVSWLSGIGAYVLHTGPGVRGGGVDDRRQRRPANIWETENWAEIGSALSCVRFTLPPALAGWKRLDDRTHDHPFETRAASGGRAPLSHHPAATNRSDFVTLPLDISRPASLVARRAMTVRVVDPLTCSTLVHRHLVRGQALRLDGDRRAVIVTGSWSDRETDIQ